MRCAAGLVRLNDSAAAVLRLCDGTRSRSELIAALGPELSSDNSVRLIYEFLDAARKRAWIIEGDPADRGRR